MKKSHSIIFILIGALIAYQILTYSLVAMVAIIVIGIVWLPLVVVRLIPAIKIGIKALVKQLLIIFLQVGITVTTTLIIVTFIQSENWRGKCSCEKAETIVSLKESIKSLLVEQANFIEHHYEVDQARYKIEDVIENQIVIDRFKFNSTVEEGECLCNAELKFLEHEGFMNYISLEVDSTVEKYSQSDLEHQTIEEKIIYHREEGFPIDYLVAKENDSIKAYPTNNRIDAIIIAYLLYLNELKTKQ